MSTNYQNGENAEGRKAKKILSVLLPKIWYDQTLPLIALPIVREEPQL
jgi:hypothetical protein